MVELPAGFNPPSLDYPTRQTSIVQDANGKAIIKNDDLWPVPEPDMVIIKTVAVSINPCDWKMPSRFPTPGAKIGCDLSGFVVAIGPKVDTKHNELSIGDRVCGGVHGSNPIDPGTGAFAEYVAVHGNLLLKLPTTISWEAGAVLGASVISTLSVVFYDSLQLSASPDRPLDATSAPYVLVYGASTSTGTMALQFLQLSGYRPIATCSSRNFDLVKRFGAEAVFDYRASTCAEDIRAYTGRSLSYVLDVITDSRSQMICSGVFGRTGGRYTVLELPSPDSPVALKRTIKTNMVNGLSATGKEIALGGGYERAANPQLRQKAAESFRWAQRLLNEQKLHTHPARVIPGGFAGTIEGLRMLQAMETSGEKLVCFVNQYEERAYLQKLPRSDRDRDQR